MTSSKSTGSKSREIGRRFELLAPQLRFDSFLAAVDGTHIGLAFIKEVFQIDEAL